MAVIPVFPVLLITVISRCGCDHTDKFTANHGSTAIKFGNFLKPPPLAPLSQIVPLPFHGRRNQRINTDVSYGYQPPPPPPPPILASSQLKFPAPFYEQYNFNILPSPQPFQSTPSPSLFQKVSTWLFPSQQTSYDMGSVVNNNKDKNTIKKNCNPCNLVPWIPVIRYNNLGGKNINHDTVPTYGPPSPTAFVQKAISNPPQFIQAPHEQTNVPQLRPALPHANYGSLPQPYRAISDNLVTGTYGPPSPTHIVEPNLPTSSVQKTPLPSNSFSQPEMSVDLQKFFKNQPSTSYLPLNSQREQGSSHDLTSTDDPSSLSYTNQNQQTMPVPVLQSPSILYGSPHVVTDSLEPITPNNVPEIFHKEVPTESNADILKNDDNLGEQQLPNVTSITMFRNSYGETIANTNVLDVRYPVSAIAAETTKIKTEVLPEDPFQRQNTTLALANPAPFTLNKGRNIHTLQPVALPNLSVSPLPPIFNARPFRPAKFSISTNAQHVVPQMQLQSDNVNIAESVPIVEFTHSVEYPTTFIQSPVIDIELSKSNNQTKAYRGIPNSYVIDEIRDITSQASEDHISATKTNSDSSFESTGSDDGNNLYNIGITTGINQSPSTANNYQATFADLRGVKDEDVDKYRMESNLQNIDSPLLYLKPSIPHKKHINFFENVSGQHAGNNDYEMYDETPIATASSTPILSSDNSRSEYSENISPQSIKQEEHKPKLIQIIVPYTMSNNNIESVKDLNKDSQSWTDITKEEFQPRKVPLNSESSQITTENYSTQVTTTEETLSTVTEKYDADQYNAGINDFYDIKEPPFDIVKLQHTIDDWTEQEYSKEYKALEKSRSSEKYAKQIPDEYFTTTIPTNYETETNIYNNYEFYDHESASSIQYSVAENKSSTLTKPRKEYNTIERTNSKTVAEKNNELNNLHKLQIYTAASSFRTTTSTTTTTTTPAPWSKIETSISPLTKEKVYVVTSKPWTDTQNLTEWYAVDKSETKNAFPDRENFESDGFPFHSPRFINRPSFGFTSGGKVESGKSDSVYDFSRSWYQRINNLENRVRLNTLLLSENVQNEIATNIHKNSSTATTARHDRLKNER